MYPLLLDTSPQKSWLEMVFMSVKVSSIMTKIENHDLINSLDIFASKIFYSKTRVCTKYNGQCNYSVCTLGWLDCISEHKQFEV